MREPMTTKIGMGDYAQDIYSCVKLHFDPIRVAPHICSCLSSVCFYSAPEALSVLLHRSRYPSVRPSIRPSLRHTPVLCLNDETQRDAVFTRVATMSSFLMPSMVDRGRPCPGKIWVQGGRPPCENSRAAHISPHNSGTVIDSEKISINANRKLTMAWAFQRAIKQGHASPLTSPNGLRIRKFVVFRKISTKTIKNMLQSFIV